MHRTRCPAASRRPRRGQVQRLMTKLVGGDQQDPHSARIAFASLPPTAADHDLEPALGGAQRPLDLLGRLAAGKQEAEVAITLRQRTDGTVAPIEISSPPMPSTACLVLARAPPAVRLGSEHHHARRRRLAAEVAERQPERVAQDQLLEAHTDRSEASASTARRPSARRARASTRACRHAQLRVDGALAQPERRTGIRRRANDATTSAGSRDGVVKIVSSK